MSEGFHLEIDDLCQGRFLDMCIVLKHTKSNRRAKSCRLACRFLVLRSELPPAIPRWRCNFCGFTSRSGPANKVCLSSVPAPASSTYRNRCAKASHERRKTIGGGIVEYIWATVFNAFGVLVARNSLADQLLMTTRRVPEINLPVYALA